MIQSNNVFFKKLVDLFAKDLLEIIIGNKQSTLMLFDKNRNNIFNSSHWDTIVKDYFIKIKS